MQEYKGLTLSIFAGAFVFGIVMSSLGSGLPTLFTTIGFEKADAGRLFLAMNFAMLVSSLLFGPICDRFGFRRVLLGSTMMIAGAFVFLSRAASYPLIRTSLLLLGFGGGALNGGTNALLNDISPDRRESALNLLGIFFGLGALFTPFLIGSLLAPVGLPVILLCLVFVTLGPVALFTVAQFPPPKHEEGFSWAGCLGVLRNPLLFLFGSLLFFQSGNEFTIGGWVSTYLGERHKMDPRDAAYILALYWTAIMVGRLIVSRIAKRISASALVFVSALLSLASAIGIVLSSRAAVASIFVALIGLGFAAIFPTTLAQAGSAFAQYSGTAFSVIFVMALSGGMTAPWLVGRIAQEHGVGAGLWVTVFSCATIAVLQGIIAASRARLFA